MQSQFLDHGPHLTYDYFNPDLVAPKLAPGVYELELVEKPGGAVVPQLFKRGGHFIQPPVRYGDHSKRLEVMQGHYNTAGRSMGILLVGLKGSGKSLFAEDMGNWIIDQKQLPVIMVATPVPLGVVRRAALTIGPCMIYFDEFGKTYEKPQMRDKMIALFSDSDLRGVMFMVTANDYQELADPMVNRPGRFRFRLNFEGLEAKDVLEVALRHELTEELTVGLMRYSKSERVGYDTLDSVAEIIKGSANSEEALRRLAIINVPGWGISGLVINRLTENGKRLKFDTARYDGSELKIIALDGEKADQEREVIIPLVESREWYLAAEPLTHNVGDLQLTFDAAPISATSAKHFGGPAGNQASRRATVRYDNRSDHKDAKSGRPFDLGGSSLDTRLNPNNFLVESDFHKAIQTTLFEAMANDDDDAIEELERYVTQLADQKQSWDPL